MDNGDAVDNYYMSTGRNIKDISEILDNVIEEYIQESIDILLIPGDLTKDGEKQSHTELAEKLAKLNRHGIQVFVIPGKP